MTGDASNVAGLFEAAATRFPALPALIDRTGPVTYGDLQREMDATAAYFRERGLGAGDRVLVFVPVSIDLYRVLLALFKIGAVAVFIDEWAGYERLALCCRLADCKAFIGTWKTRWLGFVLPALRRVPLHLSASGRRHGTPVKRFTLADDAPALITFTTGSTGVPKAANRTHDFLRAQLDALLPYLQPEPGRRALVGLPIVTLCYLATGACAVLADGLQRRPRHPRPDRWLARLRQWNATELVASPYWIGQLAAYCAEPGRETPLERIFTGGAPVFPHQARQWLAAFPGTEVRVVYGSTEAEPISTISAAELAAVPCVDGLLAGEIDPGTRVGILPVHWPHHRTEAEAFERALLAPGHIGEIVVAGPHVLHSYFKNEEAFERSKIDNGLDLWHRTGDAGYLDGRGRLFLAGRCEQLIRRGAQVISPFVCEGRLGALPDVAMGTVLASADGTLAVILESRLSAAVLEPRVREALPFHFDKIKVVRRIPRDPRHHSKIDYKKLRL